MVPIIGKKAIITSLDVFASTLVLLAVGRVVGKNSEINPGGRVPVRVVISLFGAFVSKKKKKKKKKYIYKVDNKGVIRI